MIDPKWNGSIKLEPAGTISGAWDEAWQKMIEDLQKELRTGPYAAFKIGDRVKYKHLPNVSGEITDVPGTQGPYYIINKCLVASEFEIELENVTNSVQPQPAVGGCKCTCTMRELMMKGCTKHV